MNRYEETPKIEHSYAISRPERPPSRCANKALERHRLILARANSHAESWKSPQYVL